MTTYWLAFVLIPVAHAQTSSKCVDLNNFKTLGVPMAITKAATVPAARAPVVIVDSPLGSAHHAH